MPAIGSTARREAQASALTAHIAQNDLLGLLPPDARPQYKKIAELIRLNKSDLSQIAGVAKSSVRFDAEIPVPVAERLRELANIANLIAEFFQGDAAKVGLWFELDNPMLGNVSPRTMIRSGRYARLLNYVLEARAAERATPAPRTDEAPPSQTIAAS